MRYYFERLGTLVAACHYGTDNEELADVLLEKFQDVEDLDVVDPNVEDSSKDRNLRKRFDQHVYLFDLWDNILPKVDKQAQLINSNY